MNGSGGHVASRLNLWLRNYRLLNINEILWIRVGIELFTRPFLSPFSPCPLGRVWEPNYHWTGTSSTPEPNKRHDRQAVSIYMDHPHSHLASYYAPINGMPHLPLLGTTAGIDRVFVSQFLPHPWGAPGQ